MDLVKPNLSCVTSLAALVVFEDINGVMESSVGGLCGEIENSLLEK